MGFSIVGLTAVLCLFMSALASPVQLTRRDTSSDLLKDFTFYAQVAATAACDQNINGTGTEITCDQGPCELVQESDTAIIDTYHNSSAATGYIALDHTRKVILVTFRGTISKHDGWTDFQVLLRDIPELCDGCKAHWGFWEYWLSAKEQITGQLHKATKDHPDYGVAVAGHSLGGAVATLAGTALRQDGFTLDIWTFGSPRPGNHKLAEFITSQRKPVSVYRATHNTDLVPAVPFNLPGFDYSHPSPEYWIDQPTGEKVTTDVVKVIEGINNKMGNLHVHGWKIDENHGWYFGNLSICAPPADLPSKE